MTRQYVLCPDFHGATVLALLLNNHSQLSALGDGIPNRLDDTCACGAPVGACPFWSTIRARLSAMHTPHGAELLPIYPRITGRDRIDGALSKTLSLLDVRGLPLWTPATSAMRNYATVYAEFYRLVCELHGTQQFVSGAKNLTEVLAQQRFAPGVDRIRIIHLTRDPRGFFFSARKHYGAGIAKAARTWNVWHEGFRRLRGRPGFEYLLVRHEDFCRDPASTMRGIFAFLGVGDEDVCRRPNDGRKHHILGNNMVLRFDGTVREDQSWRGALSGAEQWEILQRTSPLSQTFGYSADEP